jgi:hypothetical protein
MNMASVQAAIGVSPTMANPLQFFWNGTGDTVTVAFDTQNPVGIHGNDLLAANSTYTVTVGASAMDLAGNSVGTNVPASWSTQSDVTPPNITGTTPNITAAPQAFGPGSTLTLSFDEPMETVGSSFGQPFVFLESISDEIQASVGFPSPGLDVSWAGNNLVITFITGLTANSDFFLEINNVHDLAGNRLDDDAGEMILVTPGTQSGAPTVMVFSIPNGATGVSPDTSIFMAFSRTAW